jgi:lysophospholipase L1-like esterase
MKTVFDGLILGLQTYVADLENQNNKLKNDYKQLEEEIVGGNFNLISNSGIETGQQIFAVGDSHSTFFYKSTKIISLWGGFTSEFPLSMYKLLNSNMNILDVPKIIGRGHEKLVIRENDFVLFFYGFNDIQKNINLHAKDKWEDEINNLCVNYIYLLLVYRNICKIIPVVCFIYPNPLPEAKGQDPYGTYEERHMYTKYANQILKVLSRDNGLLFFDIYDYIADENGFIKKEFTKDYIHLDIDNHDLRTYVEDHIIELCKTQT